MARRLPDPISRNEGETDEDFIARRALSKRRLQIMKRIYQSYYRWASLVEARQAEDVLHVEGEDFYLGDMLVGLETLPRRQRQSFELICLRGYTESEARDVILPNSRWSTPVQQYSDDGLKKMVIAYDLRQAGAWNAEAATRRRPRKIRQEESQVTAIIEAPALPEQSTPAAPVVSGRRVRQWDFSKWSPSHESLRDFVNSRSGLDITAAQVKAVMVLRREWHGSPTQVAERFRRKEELARERRLYGRETPEQRKTRKAADRMQKTADRIARKAAELQEQMRQMRIDAGLDPDTGLPVA